MNFAIDRMKYSQVPHADAPDPAVFVDLLRLQDEQHGTGPADVIAGAVRAYIDHPCLLHELRGRHGGHWELCVISTL